MYTLEHLLPVQNECGETPIWVPEEGALYWVDTGGRAVFRYTPADGLNERFDLEFDTQGLARRSKGEWIILTPTGIAFWSRGQNLCRFIGNPEAARPNIRFCDSAVDPGGRLIAGTYNNERFEAPDGSFYRMDRDLSFHCIDTGLVFTNGIAFSPDGKTMYAAEMFARRILAYDYDPQKGTAKNRRVFAVLKEGAGFPDGLIVDAEGYLWCGHWGWWRVTRFTPSGGVDREIMMPVPTATCMAFGGEGLNELYITTAWKGLTPEQREQSPLSGDLFRIVLDIKGRLEPLFGQG